MPVVPPYGDCAWVPDHCSHWQHPPDGCHRGNTTTREHEELRPGQRGLQVHQEPRVRQAQRQDSLQVHMGDLLIFVYSLQPEFNKR